MSDSDDRDNASEPTNVPSSSQIPPQSSQAQPGQILPQSSQAQAGQVPPQSSQAQAGQVPPQSSQAQAGQIPPQSSQAQPGQLPPQSSQAQPGQLLASQPEIGQPQPQHDEIDISTFDNTERFFYMEWREALAKFEAPGDDEVAEAGFDEAEKICHELLQAFDLPIIIKASCHYMLACGEKNFLYHAEMAVRDCKTMLKRQPNNPNCLQALEEAERVLKVARDEPEEDESEEDEAGEDDPNDDEPEEDEGEEDEAEVDPMEGGEGLGEVEE